MVEYTSTVRFKGSRPLAMAAIRYALQSDRYAMDLHRNLAGFLLEEKDREGAQREISFIAHYRAGKPIKIVVNVNPETN